MKTRATLSILWLAVGALMAQPPPPSAGRGPEAEVQRTLIEMWDAVEKGDLQRYAAYLHPDFSAFGESDVYLASGRDLELRGMADYLARVRDVHTEMHQPKVTVRGDVAWITYYWTDSGFRREGGERFASRGKSTRIFVKENGKWLCIHGHYTQVP